ncbi:unnamed protein product [Phytomonas sp. EM1]|nr:unnamed protein product [Phytomonas sp. EM1]|eukprot:CCW63589.1 unnamed protein product [Phytomonas sp. isolate EM1]
MSDPDFHDLEENESLSTESVNYSENIKKKTYASCSPCEKHKEANRCSLHSGSVGGDSLQNVPDQALKEIKMASLSENSCSVYREKAFTIYINGLPAVISSVEPFVNPHQLFPQSGLLFLDVTSQIQMTKVSESLKQEYTRLLTDSEAERERLRKKLKINRIQIARIDQCMGKCRKGEKFNVTMGVAESTKECGIDKKQTAILSTPHTELYVANKTLATTVPGNCKLKAHDDYGNSTNLEIITPTANEIALLTRRIANLKKELQKLSALAPPPILLLPSACNGRVRVYANHYYRTVKFIGEHLCLTGQLEPFLVSPLTHEANAFSSRYSEGFAGITGKYQTNINTGCSNHAPGNAVMYKINSKHQGSENEWIELEMAGIHNYLKKHPDAIADEFFKLQTEERAAYTTKTL